MATAKSRLTLAYLSVLISLAGFLGSSITVGELCLQETLPSLNTPSKSPFSALFPTTLSLSASKTLPSPSEPSQEATA